jgi:hypothetical protein
MRILTTERPYPVLPSSTHPLLCCTEYLDSGDRLRQERGQAKMQAKRIAASLRAVCTELERSLPVYSTLLFLSFKGYTENANVIAEKVRIYSTP